MSKKIPYEVIMDRMKSDVDYVAKEAYQKGYNFGFEEGKAAAPFADTKRAEEVAYMRGYQAAMENMRKAKKTAEEVKINVGDEVWNENGDCKAVVLDQSGEGVFFVLTENRCVEEWEQSYFVKSGKHHGEVTELVEKLRAEE
jgi:hypothetical protein